MVFLHSVIILLILSALSDTAQVYGFLPSSSPSSIGCQGLLTYLDGNNYADDLPLIKYKKLSAEFLDVLDATRKHAAILKSMTERMALLHHLDSGIADENDYFSYPVNSKSLRNAENELFRAAEYAVIASDRHGRNSLEAEFAWSQVDRMIKEGKHKNSFEANVLSHPSFRYNFARATIHSFDKQAKLDSGKKKQFSEISIHTQLKERSHSTMQLLNSMEELVKTDLDRIEILEKRKTDFLHRLAAINGEL